MNHTINQDLIDKRRLNNIRQWMEDLDDSELEWIVGICLTRRKELRRSIKAVAWKRCDKCALTFPYNTMSCDRCSTKNLRVIERRHNYDEILDDMKI